VLLRTLDLPTPSYTIAKIFSFFAGFLSNCHAVHRFCSLLNSFRKIYIVLLSLTIYTLPFFLSRNALSRGCSLSLVVLLIRPITTPPNFPRFLSQISLSYAGGFSLVVLLRLLLSLFLSLSLSFFPLHAYA
jgi:hypothetical protein